jgi:hypothetical protein
MSNEEKLRALLAEAAPCIDRAAAGCRTTKTLREVKPGDCACVACDIDAALVEPGETEGGSLSDSALELMEAASVRLGKGSNESLSEAAERVASERDEARAEVEKWKSRYEALRTIASAEVAACHAEVGQAYQRGAEAMREAAARECWRASDELADIPDMASEQGQAQLCATRIRALPLPEDK